MSPKDTIKALFKNVMCFVLYYSGMNAVYDALANRSSARILLYHKVNDEKGSYFPSVSISHFREHVDYLRKKFKVVPLERIASFAKGEIDLDYRSVALTFDDGYSCIYRDVLPVIDEYGLPLTVYVVADCLDGRDAMWTDRLHGYFTRTKAKALRIDAFPDKTFSLGTEAERRAGCLFVKEYLKRVDDGIRQEALLEIRKKLNAEESNMDGLMLSAEQAKYLMEAGVEFGSHSSTHPVLVNTDDTKAYDEIKSSKDKIERILDTKISGFSYPAGMNDGRIEDMVKKAGYSYACKVGGGMVRRGDDIYALERIYITDCPVYVFAVEISGLLNVLRNRAGVL